MRLIKYFFTVLTVTLLLPLSGFAGESKPASVFILGSGSSDSPWTQSVNQGIREAIGQASQPYVYYVDHLDAGRFDEVVQHDAMYHYLTRKFAQKAPDFFISAGPAASSFSMNYPQLFPAAKRVFIQPKTNSNGRFSDAAIIETEIDYSLMVEDAIRLSEPKHAYVIGDSLKPSDLHRLNSVANALEKLGVSYDSLENKGLSTLQQEVAALPEDSAIFFTPIYREHEGKGLPPVLVLKKLHQIARSPIFATSVAELGYGSVGGYLHSPEELGMMAGEAVIHISENRSVELTHNGFERIYDWTELTRWGYEDKVGQEVQIRFKPPSLWEEHKREALTVTFFLVILVALLVVLTVYNGKLKKIKNALYKERMLLEQKVKARTRELTILHQEAEEMARRDELTGLNNRRAFFEMGDLIHSQTQRTDSPYTIIMLDIDRFKSINDTYGHAAGDCVIKCVADAVLSEARKSDVVARIGGEEFAVILSNSTCHQVNPVAERMRVKVEKKSTRFDEHTLKATVSMGVAEYQPGDKGIDAVLARADKALYQAKQSGKNRVVL